MSPTSAADRRLAVAHRLTSAIVVLAAVAAAAGLLVPAIYRRETLWVASQNRGQDAVTLLALLLLLSIREPARRGVPRAVLVWLGLLGYLAYTYTGAAFAYAFNELFLVYVALFASTGAALIAALSGIDVAALREGFDECAPRRSVSVFLWLLAAILCLLWLGQILPFFTRGTLPELIVLADTPTVFVYVLDLGVVVPLSVLSGRWLWRDRPWGYVVAGLILVKAATMCLALVAMTAATRAVGLPAETGLAVAWVALAAGSLTMSHWFFGHCGAVAPRHVKSDRSA